MGGNKKKKKFRMLYCSDQVLHCLLWHGGGRMVQRCCVSYVSGASKLAYSWARPAILVAGKGRGECFYFFYFFTSILVPLKGNCQFLAKECAQYWLTA